MVDLLYLREGVWTLVDFKTDAVDDSEPALDALRDQYAPQVRSYDAHWNWATGHDIDEAGLWLADAGRWIPVEIEAP